MNMLHIFISASMCLFVSVLVVCECVCYASWLGGWSRQLLAWYMILGELKPYQREAGGFMCWVPPSSESDLVPPCSSTLLHSAFKMPQCSATLVGRQLIYACTHANTHPPTTRHTCSPQVYVQYMLAGPDAMTKQAGKPNTHHACTYVTQQCDQSLYFNNSCKMFIFKWHW